MARLLATQALALSTVLFSLPASAGLTFYTDQTSFLAATGPVQTETFNSYPEDQNAGNLDFGAFTLRHAFYNKTFVDVPSQGQAYVTDGSTNLFVNTSDNGFVELKFQTPISAFGAWFRGINPINRPFTTIYAGAYYGNNLQLGNYLPTTTSVDTLQFIGFTSSHPMDAVTFGGEGCCYSHFAIDDVVYTNTLAPVPEPETYAMLLAGLGLMGAIVRRRKQPV
jgi:hypothetical protein